MKPLICFYQEDQFVFSQDYTLHRCLPNQSVSDFLNTIEKFYNDNLKIVQINFEYDNTDLFFHQKSLYPSDKASVFILNQHEILSASLLHKKLSTITTPATTVIQPVFKNLESQNQYMQKVNFIKEQIAQGRIYQANLTAPLSAKTTAKATDLFSFYYPHFSGCYKALLPLAEYDLISFSPELFLKKNADRLITQPIKGSSSVANDFTENLLHNKKEEAELSMIVDLLRNDLNRIEQANAAKVTAHRAALQLGYIQHTYSEIEVHTTKNLATILQSTLPGGSISGCPKIESLHVIAELENYRRQAYTGCLGWWLKNEFTLNLSIRSFMKHQDNLFYHSGCGIVYDSDAQHEWHEYLLKTGVLSRHV